MMKFPKLNIETIFDLYDKGEFLPKLQELKYFCFLRGRLNAYVTDGDEIIVHISFLDKEDLILKLKSLGVIVQRLLPDDEISYGKAWPDNIKFPTPTRIFTDLVEPGKQIVFGQEVSMYVSQNYFTISINNSDKEYWYLVNYNQIESAKIIERELENIGLSKCITTEGQKEFGRYINHYHYPELFNANRNWWQKIFRL